MPGGVLIDGGDGFPQDGGGEVGPEEGAPELTRLQAELPHAVQVEKEVEAGERVHQVVHQNAQAESLKSVQKQVIAVFDPSFRRRTIRPCVRVLSYRRGRSTGGG